MASMVNKILKAEKGGEPLKRGGRLKVALGYANRYQVGISNLGFPTVWRLFGLQDGVRCERFFLEQPLGKTLESQTPLRDFDLVCFSLPYELDYLNCLQILKEAKIPPLSSNRRRPILLCGGAAPTINPEPLAPFFDLILIGEAEGAVEEICRILIEKGNRSKEKGELLWELAQIEGIYVPSLYQEDHPGSPTPQEEGLPKRIKRRWVRDLTSLPLLRQVVTPLAHFRDMYLIEVARGCGRGCRFCAAKQIYRPLRFKSKERVDLEAEGAKGITKRIGLIGSSLSDLPCLGEVCTLLAEEGYLLSLSSLRIDSFHPNLLEAAYNSGARGLTIAPEGGTERIRRILGKEVEEGIILEGVRLASRIGFERLKIYYMIGAPREGKEEIEGILDLTQKIAQAFSSRAQGITVSVNPLIPKPHTPFQWLPLEAERELKRKLKRIEVGIRRMGVRWVPKSIRQATLQAIISLGDRRVGMALYHRIEENLSWKETWERADVDPYSYIYRQKGKAEPFPWEIVEGGERKDRLWEEYRQALST